MYHDALQMYDRLIVPVGVSTLMKKKTLGCGRGFFWGVGVGRLKAWVVDLCFDWLM